MSNEAVENNEVDLTKELVDKVNLFAEVGKEIKEELLAQNESVRESYIKQEVQAKLTARVGLVQKAFVELANIKKEQAKIKGTVLYDGEGKQTSETFTKEQVESKKKLSERYGKIERAVSKAFKDADYSDLEKVIQ